MSVRIIRAEDLEPGQRILVGPGRIETVSAPTEYDQYGGVSIHTAENEILTTLPCNVKVIESDLDPVAAFTRLGGRFSPNLNAYASGEIGAHELICVLCDKAPCICGPCPKCGWNGAPGNCQACG